MKFLKLFFLCLVLSACSGTQAVYDYDEQADFTAYNSVAIYPELRSGLSQLDEKRLMTAIEGQLTNESLSFSSNPDLYLNVYTEEYREQSRNSLGIGLGGTGRNVGVGVSGGIPLGGPETYLRLTFDLIDVSTDALVWQAVVDSKFDFNANPEERQRRFNKIVEEAFKAYPPKR
ncbi:DUF4136 domain-containing protein [Salinimicrobium xinjiangense]|uniref:DUF4136 domain-containing protein n=1 Tax=Salinimicrobium xinjiangense TaxID=438596 RepID=UPI000408A5BF|nr:DUF4136 domain-containing protein [Salinimicrobium xinjiangense]